MERTFRLVHPIARANAIEAIRQAPDGYAVTIKPRRRSLDQNAKFHAICSDLERSGLAFRGKARTSAQWKAILISGHAIATQQECEVVEGIEGEVINLRESSAAMSVQRGSSLIEYAIAFCAMNGIGGVNA
ncbi:MAG TPA: recombination protein NinB [Burkholderiaceae bacterium]